MSKVLQEISFDEIDNTKDTYITYRIRSDVIDPKEISKELCLQPDNSHYKGEKYLGNSWNPETRKVVKIWTIHDIGIWNYSTKNKIESKRVEEHILYLLDRIEPASTFLEKLLEQSEVYTISLLIHWVPLDVYGSFQVMRSTITRIAKLCHFIEYYYSS
jgi:hypothetical protein